MIQKNIWLIGTGLMGLEYARVLKALGCGFEVIGRGEANCIKFKEATGITPQTGGIGNFLSSAPALPEAAIVAVGIENLASTTLALVEYGVNNILLEKPGVGYPSEIDGLVNAADRSGAKILLAYNRRFYTSTLAAQQMIEEDGGASSLHFEFTEWSHVIAPMKKHIAEHHNWFLGNSSHVIDTAFFLCGEPLEMSAYVRGGLAWHPSSSVFAGAGITTRNVLFSYNANWEAPGRWSLEVLTTKRRFIFKPMEKLQVQHLGSVAVNPVEINDQPDIDFKPGLYLQTKSFLEEDLRSFADIHHQKKMIDSVYCRMANYTR